MTSSIQDVEEALARHQADPSAFGPMVAARRSSARARRRTRSSCCCAQRQILAELRPGEFFGEISLLYEVPVTANVEADGPLTFFALRQADFRAFLRDNPRAGSRLYRVARRRLGYGDTNHGISAEHALVPGPVPVVPSTFGGQTCPDCGATPVPA